MDEERNPWTSPLLTELDPELGAQRLASVLDTSNRFVVDAHKDQILISGIPTPKITLSHDDAVNLAAWLVALTGRRALFNALLDCIEGK